VLDIFNNGKAQLEASGRREAVKYDEDVGILPDFLKSIGRIFARIHRAQKQNPIT
jgi:hypothetical protein